MLLYILDTQQLLFKGEDDLDVLLQTSVLSIFHLKTF